MYLLRILTRRLIRVNTELGSMWRKLSTQACYANVQFKANVRIDHNVNIRTYDGGSIKIGSNTHIWPGSIIDAKGGDIIVGENSLINAGCYIVSTEKIQIGSDALIAEYVTIRDQNHGSEELIGPYNQQGRAQGPIIIGSNVWIGAKVTITSNVNIPSGTIIGANSVVTKTLTGARVFVGAPARPI